MIKKTIVERFEELWEDYVSYVKSLEKRVHELEIEVCKLKSQKNKEKESYFVPSSLFKRNFKKND